jgi:hypothetical protein
MFGPRLTLVSSEDDFWINCLSINRGYREWSSCWEAQRLSREIHSRVVLTAYLNSHWRLRLALALWNSALVALVA